MSLKAGVVDRPFPKFGTIPERTATIDAYFGVFRAQTGSLTMKEHEELGTDSAHVRTGIMLVVLAIGVGTASGYSALALWWLIGIVQELFFGIGHGHLYSAAARLDKLHVMLAPMLGGLAVGLFMRFVVSERRNHGPEDVMQAVHEGTHTLTLRAGLSSALASALAIGSGASLGRYGPTVHLGASVAAQLGQRFRRVRAERHILIGCGVAAAISASFNAPLAGVLFAHEVVLAAFARRGFVAITIASVTGQVIARVHGGQFALASLSEHYIGYNHEYLLFALVGVCGGLLAIVFIKGMDLSVRAVARVRLPMWFKPAVAGLAVGALATHYPQVLGLGDEAIHDAIAQLFTLPLLLALMLAKLLAACVCRGFGMPGGVFGPALFLGVMLGSALGQSLQWVDPSLVSSLPIYAVAGMGAVTSCVIGAPITTILIVFELTASYALTSAVMIAVVCAHLTVNRLYPLSWFHLLLMQRGVDLYKGRTVRIMQRRKVHELLGDEQITATPHESINSVHAALLHANTTVTMICCEDGKLLGRISLVDAVRAVGSGDGNATAGQLAVMPGIVLTQDQDLDAAMKQLRYFKGAGVPVVDTIDNMHFVGVLNQSSLIAAYGDAVSQAHEEEHGRG
jgi:CIC family chloride channel protein